MRMMPDEDDAWWGWCLMRMMPDEDDDWWGWWTLCVRVCTTINSVSELHLNKWRYSTSIPTRTRWRLHATEVLVSYKAGKFSWTKVYIFSTFTRLDSRTKQPQLVKTLSWPGVTDISIRHRNTKLQENLHFFTSNWIENLSYLHPAPIIRIPVKIFRWSLPYLCAICYQVNIIPEF